MDEFTELPDLPGLTPDAVSDDDLDRRLIRVCLWVGLVACATAVIVFPLVAALIFVLTMATFGFALAAGYWFEIAQRLQAELFSLGADRDHAIAGRVEAEHELQQHLDATGPIPFRVVHPKDADLPNPLRLIPGQREAGEQS